MSLAPETSAVAQPRGDEVHVPLTANPYPQGSLEAHQYENGWEYAQTLGHAQLAQANPEGWRERAPTWRNGFADAASTLGLGQFKQLKAATAHAVIFDIDGTLVAGMRDQTPLPGRLERIKALKDAGAMLFCATNRSSYGQVRAEEVEQLNEAVLDTFGRCIESVYWLSTPGPLQKPSGYLIRACMEQNGLLPATTMYVGNEENDEAAALDAGVSFCSADDFFGAKCAEWTSDRNKEVHAEKHGPEFGGKEKYLRFAEILDQHPELLATFEPVNQRVTDKGVTTGHWSPVLRMLRVTNEDGKTVSLYHKGRDPNAPR